MPGSRQPTRTGSRSHSSTLLAETRIVARGPKARGAIQAAGLQADWVAESETSAEVAEVLLSEGVQGLRIAIQHHGAGADGLDEVFEKAGAQVASLVVYRWGPAPDPAAVRDSVHALADGEIDAVVFTSAPGAEAWIRTVEEERPARSGTRPVRRRRDGCGRRRADHGEAAGDTGGSCPCSPSAAGSGRSSARWWAITSTSSPSR